MLYDWAGGEAGDLPLREGQLVRLLRWVSPEWLEGSLDAARTGRFPAVFVDVTVDIPVTGPRCVAEFDFEGASAHELSFGAGDVIALLGHCSADWLRGALQGREGVFPANFVTIEQDVAAPVVYEARGRVCVGARVGARLCVA